jgi:hypothetical protein
VKTDLDTLATALYARTDDELEASPRLTPWRPEVGIAPTLSDAELVTLAVMSALLGYTSERRWLRRAHRDFRHPFPYLPQQPGYNKRLRRACELVKHMIRVLAQDTSLWTDDVWVVDSTPVGCGCSRETAKRPDLAGWAEYGYCASHSRYFWGLRLHLVCTLGGLPVLFALTGAKADERETLRDMLDTSPEVQAGRPRQTIIGDKTPAGVTVRVLFRILALTAAIWLNDKTGQPVKRSLTAYDHGPQQHPLDSFIWWLVRAGSRTDSTRSETNSAVTGSCSTTPLRKITAAGTSARTELPGWSWVISPRATARSTMICQLLDRIAVNSCLTTAARASLLRIGSRSPAMIRALCGVRVAAMPDTYSMRSALRNPQSSGGLPGRALNSLRSVAMTSSCFPGKRRYTLVVAVPASRATCAMDRPSYPASASRSSVAR